MAKIRFYNQDTKEWELVTAGELISKEGDIKLNPETIKQNLDKHEADIKKNTDEIAKRVLTSNYNQLKETVETNTINLEKKANIADLTTLESTVNNVESSVSSNEREIRSLGSNISSVKSTANSAKTAAESAQSTANSAKTAAESAQSTANSAKTLANNLTQTGSTTSYWISKVGNNVTLTFKTGIKTDSISSLPSWAKPSGKVFCSCSYMNSSEAMTTFCFTIDRYGDISCKFATMENGNYVITNRTGGTIQQPISLTFTTY